MPRVKPVMLLIMDGWGINPCQSHNAIFAAKRPVRPLHGRGAGDFFIRLRRGRGPAGRADGQFRGGHLNLGAGRIVYQEFTRVSKAVADGSFFQNAEFLEALRRAKQKGGALHLLGLLSDGGVHWHNTHLYALLKLAKQEGVKKVFVHALLDGRDTPPASGAQYMRELVGKMSALGVGQVATVAGRYYTMDRDKRWERVELGYRALVDGEGVKVLRPGCSHRSVLPGRAAVHFSPVGKPAPPRPLNPLSVICSIISAGVMNLRAVYSASYPDSPM